jgi:hypothetical protein
LPDGIPGRDLAALDDPAAQAAAASIASDSIRVISAVGSPFSAIG